MSRIIAIDYGKKRTGIAVSDTLLIMRPYQIAATERILWKIKSAYQTVQTEND